MSKFIDLTGQTFGRLKVIERLENNKYNRAQWLCRCECGNEVIVLGSSLKRGSTQSCGCLNRLLITKHGMSRTKIYSTWHDMKVRCYNKNCARYEDYGGRGIKVCERWKDSFENFYADVSILPHYGEKGYTIDRIDNDKDYEPGNVRWATYEEQANNRRNNRLRKARLKRGKK